MKNISFSVPLAAALFLATSSASGLAQSVASLELPSAPDPQQSSAASTPAAQPAHEDPQTKRILGIFPNFRAVSSSEHLPPQPVKEKFSTATQDSFDYSAFVLPALLSGEGELANSTPEFHDGAAGYGRYFWHSFVDQTVENYMVEFIVPTITKEDTRYYTLGHAGGGGLKRMGYAVTRSVVTRSDAGKETFNFSEVVGAGAAAGISNLYYPQQERTVSNTMSKWGLNVGIDAFTFVLREFWPDVNHFLFHGKTEMH